MQNALPIYLSTKHAVSGRYAEVLVLELYHQ